MLKLSSRIFHAAAVLLLAAHTLAPLAASAQAPGAYPNKPVRWILAIPAGGGLDFVTRAIANDMAPRLGQPLVIENRPGASGAIGTDFVAKQPADGYTLLTIDSGTYASFPFINKNLPYDPPKDFQIVATLVRIPFILNVNPGVPAANFQEFVRYAKANPGKITYASTGMGNALHLAMEMLVARAGINLYHVPYKSMPNAIGDLVSGQVQAVFGDVGSGRAFILNNRIRPLALAASARLPFIPDVPTFGELGFKDFNPSPWVALGVRTGTPAAIVDRLGALVQQTLSAPETTKKLTDVGIEIFLTVGKEANDFALSQVNTWGEVVKPLNIKFE